MTEKYLPEEDFQQIAEFDSENRLSRRQRLATRTIARNMRHERTDWTEEDFAKEFQRRVKETAHANAFGARGPDNQYSFDPTLIILAIKVAWALYQWWVNRK